MKNLIRIAAVVLAVTAGCAQAGEFQDKARALAQGELATLINAPEVIEAVKAQNEKNAGLSQAQIDALESKWAGDDATLIDPVLNNSLSKYLKDIVAKSNGLYTEIFVMDSKGLNVGQSGKTSDYWQGDEDKWAKTYGEGAGSLHLSDVEQDESSQQFQLQVSIPVVDGGVAIGAATIGVDAETLEKTIKSSSDTTQ